MQITQGPRPLPLLVAIQTMTWLTSTAALSALSDGSLSWRPEVAAAGRALEKDLKKELRQANPNAFAEAVDRQTRARLGGFADGVASYRRLCRPARLGDPPVIWRQGAARLFDYGATAKKAKDGKPLLVVPSLVNRSYILDLLPGLSLMRDLARRGFRPLLLDWDWPGKSELEYSLDDYIGGVLEDALAAVNAISGQKPAVIGYCMGGNLAVALAQRRADDVSSLVLMATPWDFHTGDGAQMVGIKAMRPGLEALLGVLNFLPVDVLQSLFVGLDPYLPVRKFRRFARLDKRSRRARHFLALEDWLNDGVPLAAPVARQCLFDWYLDNATANETWTVRGRPVRPGEVTTPTLVIIPARDHIVPPASARPLAKTIPGAESWTLAAGHIGMVAGSRAAKMLYEPLARWLRDVT
jgi:polyhydroxyalkanoate synthase